METKSPRSKSKTAYRVFVDMGYTTACCCVGGCNGWPGAGNTGFGSTDPFSTCGHCDANQINEEECCGPPAPQSVTFSASTQWAWSWSRTTLGACEVCQGTNIPSEETAGDSVATTVNIPNASWKCGSGDTELNRAMFWGGTPELGETSSGAWWINGGNINMTLEMDQELAAAVPEDFGGAVSGFPPGCCAKYYYSKCDVTGPAKPAFTTNPFEYVSGTFDDWDAVSSPSDLEAWGRLALLTGGWSDYSNPDLPPSLVLRATFTLYVGIRGAMNHFIDANNTPAVLRRSQGVWISQVVQEVEGCSCGQGISLVDQLDWSSLVLGAPGSGWNYAWPFPAPNHSDTATYGTSPGTGCTGSGFNCPGGGRTICPSEVFTILGVEGCCNCTGLADGACSRPWTIDGSDPAAGTACNVWSGRNDGLEVWSYPKIPAGSGVSVVQNPDDGTWGVANSAYNGLSSEGTTFHCIRGTDGHPCESSSGLNNGSNTGSVCGGFSGGGDSSTAFPACGLTDVQFGIGAVNPYA